MPGAARVNDQHLCPAFDGPKPHGGGPILPPASVDVQTNALGQARATDPATCVGPPDFIVTGSGSVLVNGLPAVRLLDKTAHGGSITSGSLNVIIGGPTVGSTLGNIAAANAACAAAAASRMTSVGHVPGSVAQTNNNCGVESARQIINQATGAGVTEDGLLNWAISTNESGFWNWLLGNRLAESKRTRVASGGTTDSARVEILRRNGVSAREKSGTIANVAQPVAERRGVIIPLDAALLWPTTSPLTPAMRPGAWHAVVATGAQYDPAGNLVAIFINDTGVGQCGVRVPVAVLTPAMSAHGGTLAVTNNPVW